MIYPETRWQTTGRRCRHIPNQRADATTRTIGGVMARERSSPSPSRSWLALPAPPPKHRRGKGGRRQQQTAFVVKAWGGPRRGAGRKPAGAKARVSHAARPLLAKDSAVHVTLRVVPGVTSLRKPKTFRAIVESLQKAKDRHGVRLVHWSVQGNHLHLIVEADSKGALSTAMQGLNIRVAKAINRAQGRRGRVFEDHYAARVLSGPTQVAHAIRYVLENLRHHAVQFGSTVRAGFVDPCSSNAPGAPAARPNAWVLAVGWRRIRLGRARWDAAHEP
jgi:putative transposase